MEPIFCPSFVFMYFWNDHKYEMWPLLISNESCKKSGANWWSSIKFSSITFHWIVDSFLFLHTYINTSLSRITMKSWHYWGYFFTKRCVFRIRHTVAQIPQNVKKPQTWCDCHWYFFFFFLFFLFVKTYCVQ